LGELDANCRTGGDGGGGVKYSQDINTGNAGENIRGKEGALVEISSRLCLSGHDKTKQQKSENEKY